MKSVLDIEVFKSGDEIEADRVLERLTPARCRADARYVSFRVDDKIKGVEILFYINYTKFLGIADSSYNLIEYALLEWYEGATKDVCRLMKNIDASHMDLQNLIVCFADFSKLNYFQGISGNVSDQYLRAVLTIPEENFARQIITIQTEQGL